MQAMTALVDEVPATRRPNSEPHPDERLLAALTNEIGRERTRHAMPGVVGVTGRNPEFSAALAALLISHGLRRFPESRELEHTLRHARRRQQRSRSGGPLARMWLRATDRAFVRDIARNHATAVVAAVNTTSHDAAEIRLVGELAATITTYYYEAGVDFSRQAPARAESETLAEAPVDVAVPVQRAHRTALRPLRRPRFSHRTTVTREQSGVGRNKRGTKPERV